MSMKPEKVIRGGMVAVLISPRFGAGWSSWAGGKIAEEMALFDRRFVEAAEAGIDDIEPIAKDVLGDEYFCCGGWRGIRIEWLPVGTAFTVEEYDGSESLRTVDSLWRVA